jgi:Flp pilus assembly protein protease CpaA
MIETMFLILAFSLLAVGSYTDIKTREVPDWLSYGGIVLGLVLRGGISLYLGDYSLIVYGAIGFAVFFLIGCAMFYTGQWGGGDSKILMALGALVGINFSLEQITLSFLVNLIMVSAIYSVIWVSVVALKNKNKFIEQLKKDFSEHYKHIKLMFFAGVLATTLIILFLFMSKTDFFFKSAIASFTLALWLLYYLFVVVKTVEKACMIRQVAPEKITEGDWIAEEVFVDNKRICGPKDLGIEKEQIKELLRLKSKNKIKTVLVKYGIPFVPSFLLAFLVSVLFGNFVVWMV